MQWKKALQGFLVTLSARPLTKVTLLAIACWNLNAAPIFAAETPVEPQAHIGKALDFLRSGLYEQAQEEFRIALQIDPSNLDAQMGLGHCLYQLRQYREASQVYHLALRYQPSSEIQAQARSGLGDVYLQLGANEDALNEYSKALSFHPQWLGVRLNRSRALTGLEEYALAARELSRVLQSSPNLPEAHQLQSAIWLALEKPEAALQALEKAILLNPQAGYAAYRQLNQLLRLNHRYELAVELGDRLAQLSGYNGSDAYQLLGDSLSEWAMTLGEQRQRQAAKGLSSAQGPSSSELNRRAAEAYSRAALVNPGSAIIRQRLAAALWDSDQPGRAIATVEQAIALEPRNASLYRDLANYSFQQGHAEAAQKLLRQLVQQNPDDLASRLLYIETLAHEKRWSAAVRSLKNAIGWGFSRDPELAACYDRLAKIYELQGDLGAAQRTRQTLLKRYPTSPYAYWITALDYQKKGNWDAALVVAQKAQEGLSDQSEIYTLIAQLLLSQGKAESAIIAARQASEMAPNDVSPLLLIAKIQMQLKRLVEAKATYRQAIAIDVDAEDALDAFWSTLKDPN